MSKDAKQVLKELNEKYDLFIVTSYIFQEAKELCGVVLKQKYDFLLKHFPFLNPYKFIFAGNKELLNIDIKIDDKIDNLKNADIKLLFTAYHNINYSKEFLKENGVIRVDSFKKIRNLLID